MSRELKGYAWPDGHPMQVVYLTQDSYYYIYELSAELEHSRSQVDLTTLTGDPVVVDLT